MVAQTPFFRHPTCYVLMITDFNIPMKPITFFDLEISSAINKVMDFGAFRGSNDEFHGTSASDFIKFLSKTDFIAGHNVLRHDLKYIQKILTEVAPGVKVIDTLDPSPLLFPARPYHHLVKDDKLITDELNNPLNDAKKARELFYEEVEKFKSLDPEFQSILFGLLQHEPGFQAFFEFLDFHTVPSSLEEAIRQVFATSICSNSDISKLISQYPASLAYCLSLIRADDQYSIMPRWLQYNRPNIAQVMNALRSHACIRGCPYCNLALDAKSGLKSFFGYEEFRRFGDEPLQENAVKSALTYQSLLAIFPTGGGKSATFQLPALMQGQHNKGLTVIISPLQSLMKDQVDNLEKAGIVCSVTINGLLDPIERAESFERVEDGRAQILYLSPESLRSPSIERLLLGRHINRFVIDEAHCFSSWGHDFRVDYLYIGDFIKNIQEKRQQDMHIPVSCFTATAKPQVIEDICEYFRRILNLELIVFQTNESRKNLRYVVYEQSEDTNKYTLLRDVLSQRQVPAIIYVSRTKKAEELAQKLSADGFPAKPYHGKLAAKVKTDHQDAFLAGEVNIMVATSAFGMGVDKKDIQTVIHYEISDSLENYVQEAGRAGRDEKLEAECFILYDEEDLNKHFILQNSTRLTLNEIKQIWKAIKDLTMFRNTISKSALEIARQAGWDDSVREMETRVTTAIAALEEAGYVKRKNNQARIYADSLQYNKAQEAIDVINASLLFSEHEKNQAIRIVKKLISSKRISEAQEDDGESRVDYLADTLGIPVSEALHIITLMRQEKLLADAKDLTVFIETNNPEGKLDRTVKNFHAIFSYMREQLKEEKICLQLKVCREEIQKSYNSEVTVRQIRTALIFLGVKDWVKLKYKDFEKNIAKLSIKQDYYSLAKNIEDLLALAPFVGQYLINKSKTKESSNTEILTEFSIVEIQEAISHSGDLQFQQIPQGIVEDVIYYLTKIEAMTIEGGFLVIYKRLIIERRELNNKILYKVEDYKDLEQFYENKIQQVHIVGEYARKMIHDYAGALRFVEDYFQMECHSFLRKYFPGSQDLISKPITPRKFQELIGTLSLTQAIIVIEDASPRIAVLAGPGSGKTKLLVHKLAHSVLMENLKHDQILMLTFSRSAVTEFKKRLYALIGNAAAFIQIKTFHSYCFDLLGKIGDLRESENVIRSAIESIRDQRVEPNRIAKLLFLIDEAQDMNADEYELIQLIARQNENMRLILVGDDDQNIYEFRQSSSKYLADFITSYQAQRYDLLENFRSDISLVEFTNRYLATISNRLKTLPIVPRSSAQGEVRIIECPHGQQSSAVSALVMNAEITGSTAVLCQTNQEAAEVNSILRHHRIHARLIQSNEGFDLANLVEVRTFLELVRKHHDVMISKEGWNKAIAQHKQQYQRSIWWPMMERIWKDFETANQKSMYVSDLEAFLRESRMEDFIYDSSEAILISTYHKAKGREFDNVFITVDRPSKKDDDKRALYVAMTRAKHKLIILSNGNFLKPISVDVAYSVDTTPYKRPEELSYVLTHEDVNLGHFASKQTQIKTLMAGDALQVNEDGCKDMDGNFVVRFSKKFQLTILSQQKAGYEPNGVGKVNFIIYWQVEEGVEVRVVLPEVTFRNT
jgi:ATP-dependent DNA helicase RecQ